MYKRADHNEQFSELFTCELGKALSMNIAEYIRGFKCVKTIDFTDNAMVNFEAAYSWFDEYSELIPLWWQGDGIRGQIFLYI